MRMPIWLKLSRMAQLHFAPIRFRVRQILSNPPVPASDYFDAQYYLRENPDVARANADPLKHFTDYGKAEGRHPNAIAATGASTFRLSDFCSPDHQEDGPRASDEAFFISVLTPAYNTPPRYLRELFQTLLNQRYANWEWVVVDDGSSNPATISTLRELATVDSRLRLILNPANAGISAASNIALSAARGTHAALVDHDDLLPRDAFLALYEGWRKNNTAKLFFTDECKLLPDGTVGQFWPKPDWSPAYLENTMCVGHLSVYEMVFLRELGGFRSLYDGTQDYDLVLRASLRSPQVQHLAVFAYIWRVSPGSSAAGLDQKSYAIDRQGAAVLDYARQKSPDASIVRGWDFGYWRIVYPLPSPAPLLSYIIPTGGGSREVRGTHVDLVTQCVQSFEQKAFYPNREYVVIHNGDLSEKQKQALKAIPRLVLVHYETPAFNLSKKLNLGVRHARGEFICLLNDDVEAITCEGGVELISYLVANPGVGAIGPLCLFEDGSIQQNGVILLNAMGPAHAGAGRPRNFGGHQSILRCRREAFSIGGAVLIARKAQYEAVGGFSEDLPLNYNDVDFCLRVRERGLTCVVDPQIEVYHYEGVTKVGTSAVEQERMFLGRPDLSDPYFSQWFDPGSPNYSLNLNRRAPSTRHFGPWLDRHIARRAASLTPAGRFKLSVCVQVQNHPKRLLEEMSQSVSMQTYGNKELVILDNGSSNPETLAWLDVVRRASRATVVRAEKKLTPRAANLKLLETITGDFFVGLDAGDFLSVDALQVLAYVIERNPTKSIFYSDNYEADINSTRSRPFVKPDFDPILLMGCCYPTHLMAINAEALRRIATYTVDMAAGCPHYDILTRILAAGEEPIHVSELIYARRRNGATLAHHQATSESESVAARRFALMRLLQERAPDGSLSLESNSLETSTTSWRLTARRTVPGVRVISSEEAWGTTGQMLAGVVKAAREPRVEWIAIMLTPDNSNALLELSALALFDPRVVAVCGILTDTSGNTVRWSGGLFLPGGRIIDPYSGRSFADSGYHGQLWMQRCVDVAAPVNVVIRAVALLRAAAELKDDTSPDGLMTILGFHAHQRRDLVAVTPHLRQAAPPTSLALPPLDRAGRLLGAPTLERGGRWYDARLEVEGSCLGMHSYA
jgi:glycosyltransferase involved in cell wall biosynthesis